MSLPSRRNATEIVEPISISAPIIDRGRFRARSAKNYAVEISNGLSRKRFSHTGSVTFKRTTFEEKSAITENNNNPIINNFGGSRIQRYANKILLSAIEFSGFFFWGKINNARTNYG